MCSILTYSIFHWNTIWKDFTTKFVVSLQLIGVFSSQLPVSKGQQQAVASAWSLPHFGPHSARPYPGKCCQVRRLLVFFIPTKTYFCIYLGGWTIIDIFGAQQLSTSSELNNYRHLRSSTIIDIFGAQQLSKSSELNNYQHHWSSTIIVIFGAQQLSTSSELNNYRHLRSSTIIEIFGAQQLSTSSELNNYRHLWSSTIIDIFGAQQLSTSSELNNYRHLRSSTIIDIFGAQQQLSTSSVLNNYYRLAELIKTVLLICMQIYINDWFIETLSFYYEKIRLMVVTNYPRVSKDKIISIISSLCLDRREYQGFGSNSCHSPLTGFFSSLQQYHSAW